jgi:hypothetical protein
MMIEQLISRLSVTPPKAVHMRWLQRLLLSVIIIVVISVEVTLFGVRPDILTQIMQPAFLIKLVAVAGLLALGTALLWQQTQPDASTKSAFWLTGSIPLLALLALLFAHTRPVGREQLQCVVWISLYGLPALGLFAAVARLRAARAALPTSLALGTSAWACSALGYGLHCQADLSLGGTGNLTMLALYILAWPALCALAYVTKCFWLRW